MNKLFLIFGGVTLTLLVGWAVLAFWAPASAAISARWKVYVTWLDGELKSIYSPMRARSFVLRQVAFAAVGILGGVVLDSIGLGVVVAVALGYMPLLQLSRDRLKRRAALEAQLDSTLQSLANTILVTQNLEDAFETVARQFDPPISQEADVLVKQVRLGMPMDEALQDLARRTQSRSVDGLVTALTIGRQTGGELPKVLETIAQVLRETTRVEGMMAAKTSEGKAQGLVMGMLPFVFGGGLQIIDPDWMRPLFKDPIGYAVLAVVCVLEIVGVAAIRKLSAIDV